MPAHRGDFFCSLHGAPQIAAVERRKTFPRQPLRQRLGLDNSLLGQLTIEVPLTNPANIPFGLAMSNNNHLRTLHECLSRMVRGKKSTAVRGFCSALAPLFARRRRAQQPRAVRSWRD